MRTLPHLMIAVCVLYASPRLGAATLYSQDFDALSSGSIGGQDGWILSTGAATVQSDVLVSGRALLIEGGVNTSVRRLGITGDTSRIVEYDLRLDKTITDYPELRNTFLQNDISRMLFDGSGVSLSYRGEVDSSGVISFSRFSFSMLSTAISPEVESDVWYHVQLMLDANINIGRIVMTRDGDPWWDSGDMAQDLMRPMPPGGYHYSFYLTNTSYADRPVDYFVDNLRVTDIPEPATLSLLALGGLTVLRRKRK